MFSAFPGFIAHPKSLLRRLAPSLCASVFCLGMGPAAATGAFALSAKAIYGDDDRREVDDPSVEPMLAKAAESVAIILRRSSITIGDAPFQRRLKSQTFGVRYQICQDERFYSQPSPGYCSGFLVNPTTLVTAGHCVRSAVDCSNSAYVFGFTAAQHIKRPELVKMSDIYYCRAIKARHLDHSTGIDYTILQLNRASERPPLKLRLEGEIATGTKVSTIGHPMGLPMKITSGGTVEDNEQQGYFITDLDALSGSSGSPVINDETGLVEGLIVRGENDFEYNGSCNRIRRCGAGINCRGEAVTRISTVLQEFESLP